jgi:DNA-binding response OmpR family regulator
MIARAADQPQVFVVDANVGDYQDLASNLSENGYHLEICANGRAALRLDPSKAPEMWVVNMNLPDISGPNLLSMLRWRYPGVPICLVSDNYRAEDEITARCSGAELYLCKPLESEWLTAAATQH